MANFTTMLRLMEAGIILLVGLILLSPLLTGEVVSMGPSGLTIKGVESGKGYYYYSNSQINKREFRNLSHQYNLLLSKKNELESSLHNFKTRLNPTEGELQTFKQKFKSTEDQLNETRSRLRSTKDRLETARQNVSQLKSDLNKLLKSGYLEFEPELKEIESFLEKNKLNELEYSEENFDCLDFANQLVIDLREQENIYACKAYVKFENNSAHSVVALKTKDKGIVYIEPKDEQILYELEEGGDFCEKVNWNCQWEIKRVVDCWK